MGSGLIGGIGLGLGYISPVSTLIKWFPDRRGMATGMAIMGFGGGAMIGSPLANILMSHFKTATTVGVWQTFVAMAAIYFVFMLGGAFGYRVPAPGWRPWGWVPTATKNAMITRGNVHLNKAHKTPQFWLIWIVLCLNVSAGIGIIGAASPMLQETFGGRLFGQPDVGFGQFTDAQRALAAAVGAGFVGLFSLFNIGGRFFWASLSDRLGRKSTYFVFFGLGMICFGLLPTFASLALLALFALSLCIIASMYGGGFATVPAYLADMFGTQFVGAIHGRLLTAWSTAGILGPVIVNFLHDSRKAAGVPYDQVYAQIFYVLVGLLALGFFANMLIRPVSSKWFMREEEVAALQPAVAATSSSPTAAAAASGSGISLSVILAWVAVGIPLAWGVWMTAQTAIKILS